MKISIVTLFPEMFEGPFNYSIVKRAIDKKVVKIELVNLRNFGLGKHKVVDDKPYGGGVGMVLRVDVLKKAIESTKCQNEKCKEKIILLDPQGTTFNQKKANNLAKIDHLILVCGHYEGVDERIRSYVNEEISIGDYILTGGELPAMIVAESIVRLLPGALGKEKSSREETFEELMEDGKKLYVLEYPQYTRPEQFNNLKVPKVLLSGNHSEINKWRREESIKKTKKKRPDLLE